MGETAVTSRLRRVEGQVRGLQRMLEQEASCEEVLTQLIAARSALDQIGLLIIDGYIDNCMQSGAQTEIRENVRRIFSLILGRYSVPVKQEDISQLTSPAQQELLSH